jgi:tetratricopeptide (TPR) repeat protein
MRRALEIDETSSGKDHPDVATDLSNLALLFSATNRLADAEPLMRRALEIDEKSFGKDHPKVAIRLDNLAGLLNATNRPAEGEPLYRRARDINEKSYGKDHPNVAINLHNLARLLHNSHRLAEAEPLLRRALEIFLRSQFRVGHKLLEVGVVSGIYRTLLAEMDWSQERIEEQIKMLTEGCNQEVAKERQ